MNYLNFDLELPRIAKNIVRPAKATVNTYLAPYGDAAMNAGASLLGLERADPNALERSARQDLSGSVRPFVEPIREAIGTGLDALRQQAIESGARPVIEKPYLPSPKPTIAPATTAQAPVDPAVSATDVQGVVRVDRTGQSPEFANIPGLSAPPTRADRTPEQEYLAAADIYRSMQPAPQAPTRPTLSGSGGIFSALNNLAGDTAQYVGDFRRYQDATGRTGLKAQKLQSEIQKNYLDALKTQGEIGKTQSELGKTARREELMAKYQTAKTPADQAKALADLQAHDAKFEGLTPKVVKLQGSDLSQEAYLHNPFAQTMQKLDRAPSESEQNEARILEYQKVLKAGGPQAELVKRRLAEQFGADEAAAQIATILAWKGKK